MQGAKTISIYILIYVYLFFRQTFTVIQAAWSNKSIKPFELQSHSSNAKCIYTFTITFNKRVNSNASDHIKQTYDLNTDINEL